MENTCFKALKLKIVCEMLGEKCERGAPLLYIATKQQ